MQELHQLISALPDLLHAEYLFICIIGVIMGTLVGALPGLGPASGMVLMLPLTFGMDAISALLLLTSIYQGAMFGGRISAILINVPGDPQAVVTAFDGYPLTKKGKAGFALTLSAIASFIGGIFGFIGLVFLMGPITSVALKFGAPEYFCLTLFALIVTSGVIEKKPLRPMMATLLGLLIASVGIDQSSGVQRFTFGMLHLWNGIDFVAVVVGLFGLSEVLIGMEQSVDLKKINAKMPFSDLFPKLGEVLKDRWAILRGSVIGFLIGILPGVGGTVATFMAYALEKKLSKNPEEFGQGASKGISAPESANNASVGGALIPLFSLGIPGSGAAAILLGAFMMHGLQPGPFMLEKSGHVIWPVIAGLFLANVLLLIVNTAFVPAFSFIIMKIDSYIKPIITILCILGVYLINQRIFDIMVMVIFGIIGYYLRKYKFSVAALIVAVILGPMVENNFVRSMMMSHNNFNIFYTRPISAVLLVMSILVLCIPFIRMLLKKRV